MKRAVNGKPVEKTHVTAESSTSAPAAETLEPRGLEGSKCHKINVYAPIPQKFIDVDVFLNRAKDARGNDDLAEELHLSAAWVATLFKAEKAAQQPTPQLYTFDYAVAIGYGLMVVGNNDQKVFFDESKCQKINEKCERASLEECARNITWMVLREVQNAWFSSTGKYYSKSQGQLKDQKTVNDIGNFIMATLNVEKLAKDPMETRKLVRDIVQTIFRRCTYGI